MSILMILMRIVFAPWGFGETTGETVHLQPIYPGDRITSQCIRMMRAPALSLIVIIRQGREGRVYWAKLKCGD